MGSNFISGILNRARSSKLDLSETVSKKDVSTSTEESKELSEKKDSSDNSKSSVLEKEKKSLSEISKNTVDKILNKFEDSNKVEEKNNSKKEKVLPPKKIDKKEKAEKSKEVPKGEGKRKTKENKNEDKPRKKLTLLRVFIIFIIFILALATTLLTLSSLGYDKKFLKSNLTGEVINTMNQPIGGASVSIQDKTFYTDENGSFEFLGLEYGDYKLFIEADNYEVYSDIITLSKLKTIDVNITLKNSSFSDFMGSFQDVNGAIVDTKNMVFEVNGQVVSVSENGSYELKNQEIKEISFKFESPFYKDFEKSISLSHDTHNIEPIVLESAYDFKIVGKNFLTGENLGNYSLTYLETTYTANDQGELAFVDMEPSEEAVLGLSKDGFLDYEKTLNIDGEDKEIVLVPQGSFYYTVNDGEDTSIYVSNLDGGNQREIVSGYSNISNLLVEEDQILFTSDKDSGIKQLYFYSLSSKEVTKLSTLSGSGEDNEGRERSEEIFANQRKVVVTKIPNQGASNDNITLIVSDLNGDNQKLIYDVQKGDKETKIVTPKLSTDDSRIAYVVSRYNSDGSHLDSKVYLTDYDRTNQRLIYSTTSNEVRILSLSAGEKVAILVNQKTSEDELVIIDLQKGSRTQTSVNTKIDLDSVNFVDDSVVYFLSDSESSSLYKYEIENSLLTKLTEDRDITSYYLDKDQGLIFVREADNIFVSRIDYLSYYGEVAVQTNFKMW